MSRWHVDPRARTRVVDAADNTVATCGADTFLTNRNYQRAQLIAHLPDALRIVALLTHSENDKGLVYQAAKRDAKLLLDKLEALGVDFDSEDL